MSDKYNFFSVQENIRKKWEDEAVFALAYDLEKPHFVIDTPPPTVSGKLHIGHVFSYIHQDIIARYKRITGHNVIFPFGFDDNGLPTERYVEKKCSISSKKMSKKEFIASCYTEIQSIHEQFALLWKKLGLSYDWSLVYSTISPQVQQVSQKLFIDLYKKGLVYKKCEPALYCTAFQTSISQADLEEVVKETAMITVRFIEKESQSDILIATTRPELLGGCVAVLVHPEDSRYCHLIGKKALVPLYNHEVPIIADELVIMDKGTGIVMSATFGDGLDVHWFKKHGFSYQQIINKDGTLSEKSIFLTGLKIEQARKVIIEKLVENKLVCNQEIISHRVSVYERSKKEIEYIMLNQWFVSILPYKEELLKIADEINWFPGYMKIRYIDWVKNLSWDWCISRQRSFGIPFPVWYDQNGKVILGDESQLPCNPEEMTPVGYTQDSCTPDSDVMDTWNTSSLTPYIILDMLKKKGVTATLPLDMRPQSHDIIRTWAFDTIVKSYFLNNTIPWKNIVISGHVVTPDNQKISKSMGNSPLEPENLLKEYPADVIRYWSASAKLGVDTAFCQTQFKDGNKLIVKLWNAAICLKDFALWQSVFEQERSSNYHVKTNKSFLVAYQKMEQAYHLHFQEFDFNGALRSVEKFFWFFCDYFLEMSKIFTQENNFSELEIRETRETAAYLFLKMLQLFSPFIPFITEHLWEVYFQKNDLSIHNVCLNLKEMQENIQEDYFDALIILIDTIRKAKSERKISLKSPIRALRIALLEQKVYEYLSKDDLCNIILRMSQAEIVDCSFSSSSSEVSPSFNWTEENSKLTLHITI